jgi:DNA-binding NtrC family response regulator
MAAPDTLSVLIVDEEPAILSFLARILDLNGIRALLARSTDEAIGIARRSYVPIDLVLTDVVVRNAMDDAISESAGAELVTQLREIRPGVRSLYMSAYVDAGVIRIQLMNRQSGETKDQPSESDLISSIRGEAVAPFVFHGGGTPAR